MSSSQLLFFVHVLVAATSVIAAIVAMSIGLRVYRPAKLLALTNSPARPRSPVFGVLLMASSVGWLALAAYQHSALEDHLALLQIDSLSVSAAGISSPALSIDLASAATTARTAVVAEELAADPQHPDFLLLRGKVTERLYRADRFGQYPHPIALAIGTDPDRDTIRYLAEERPGLLTVIHHTREGDERRMLVYWPSVAGDQLIYTPLSSPTTQSLSQVVQDVVAE